MMPLRRRYEDRLVAVGLAFCVFVAVLCTLMVWAGAWLILNP